MRINIPKKFIEMPQISACGKESRTQLFYTVWYRPVGTGVVAYQSLKADHIMYWLGAAYRREQLELLGHGGREARGHKSVGNQAALVLLFV